MHLEVRCLDSTISSGIFPQRGRGSIMTLAQLQEQSWRDGVRVATPLCFRRTPAGPRIKFARSVFEIVHIVDNVNREIELRENH